MAEIWKIVPDFPLYGVSSLGRIRSKIERFRTPVGTYQCREGKKFRVLKVNTDTNGYKYIQVFHNNRRKMWRIARLVLTVFVEPCPAGKEAGHLDGKKANNKLSNLKWVTPAENYEHKKIHGTHLRGEKIHTAKLTEESVRMMRFLDGQFSRRAIHRVFGVSLRQTIGILKGRSWKHVI